MDRERASRRDELSATRAVGRRVQAESRAEREFPPAQPGPGAPVPPWAPTVVHAPADRGHGLADPTTVVPLPATPPPIQGLHRAEAPRHESRRRVRVWALVGGGLALLLVAVAGVVALTSGRADAPLPVPQVSPPQANPAAAAPGTPAATGAQARLDEQVRADAAAVAQLADRWVPQLYAERTGVQRGAATMNAETILRDYTAVKAQYPAALLLASGDFTSFALPGYYVMVAPVPFATPAEVLAWCAAERRADEFCFAKRLSRTAGPEGSTVYRD